MATRREVTYRGFDKGIPPMIVDHRFSATAKGELQHHVDGQLRATVPSEGFQSYAEDYPQCQPVLDAVTGRKPAAAAPAAAPKPKGSAGKGGKGKS